MLAKTLLVLCIEKRQKNEILFDERKTMKKQIERKDLMLKFL